MSARIKRVVASDRDDVLEISRQTWDGYDYLPSVIDEWLKDSDCHIYGVEVGSRVVAVANLRVVEGGRTGWMEGLRVHPDFRGRGYANALTRELLEEASELGVQRLRYTTGSQNEASLRLAEKYGFVRVLEMSVFWRPIPKVAPSATAHHPIRVAKPSEVYALLQANPYVVPQKVLVFDWKVLDCTLEGLETVGKSHEFYVSLEKDVMDSLSYGSLRRRGEVLLWVFTVHATDEEGFLAHLYHNVAAALGRRCNAVMCTYGVEFEKAFQGVDWGSEEHWGTRLVLLERAV